ncbi:hypothetical protein BSKO_02478 [Bryopsis sp. KO-2023]|nr:hypothetical protein BSKO_02478 [Bryopsis sp. KO-2023]
MRANRSALSLALAVLLAANSGVSGQSTDLSGQSLLEEQRDRLLDDDDGPRQTMQQQGNQVNGGDQGNDVGDQGQGESGQSLIEEQRDRLLDDDDGPRQTIQQQGNQGNDVGDRGIDDRGPGDQSNGVGDGGNANQNNGIDKRLDQVTGSQNNFDVLVDTLQISSNKQNDPNNEGSTTAVLQKIQDLVSLSRIFTNHFAETPHHCSDHLIYLHLNGIIRTLTTSTHFDPTADSRVLLIA